METEVLRDGEFESQIAWKHQREQRGFNDKILSMCWLGLSDTGHPGAYQKHLYNVEIPQRELVSHVTDEVKGLADDWWGRPLESLYPVMFFAYCA